MSTVRVLSTFSAMLIFTAVFACGSGESPEAAGPLNDSASPSGGAQIDPVTVLNPDSTFTLDQLIAAGWKQSRELSAESLPNAVSAWYGFYKQRDVEIRVYPSHHSAVADGAGPADVATGRGKPAPFAVGGISATRTSYGAYAIAGNLVVLCEVQLSECMGLIESLN
ncbi:MAG: hypothetical protein O3B04_01670 [Chloroflexi bacterium]|nr:hypothetical protein [Chloroflexota bacterium]